MGRYISLERITEESKEKYYGALNKSSQDWHEAKHDLEPWLFYFLGTILSAYREFEQRAGNVKAAKGAKTEMVAAAINEFPENFRISDIERACPSVSRDMIRTVLRKLQKEKVIESLGKGQSAEWKRMG